MTLVREPRWRVKVSARSEHGGRLLQLELQRPTDFQFQAGQYLWLVLPQRSKSRGEIDRRAYSIASGMDEPVIKLMIRLTDSEYLRAVRRLRSGDPVEIIGPFGSAFVPPRAGAVMIAGGTGVSPFLSIFRSKLPGTFSLAVFEGKGRSISSLIGLDHLLKQQAKAVSFVNGRPTVQRLKRLAVQDDRRPVFISGPRGFVTAVDAGLRRLKVNPSRLRFEAFYPALPGDNDFEKLFSILDDSGAVLAKVLLPIHKKVVAGLSRLAKKSQEKAVLEKLEKNMGLSEMFTLIAEQTSNHVVVTNHAGKVLFANQAAERLTGFSFKEMRGQSPRLWGGLMPPDYYRELWRRKASGEVVSHELLNRHRNGRLYTALGRITPIVRRGRVVAYIATEEDITHLKEIDRAKTEFISLASHQLRTPLSTVNWYAEMLLAGDAGIISKTQQRYLGEIYKGNHRMIDLVNALLNVSRLEMGTFMIEPEPTRLGDVAASVLNELKPSIVQKRLQVTTTIARSVPPLSVDPKLTRILFQNLLSNAVKYTPDNGSIKLGIAHDRRRRNVIVTVADTGYGIPAEEQAQIFTKLFRATNVRERETDGTGLGLYIVRSILEQCGGKVWFTSEEDKGTVVSFSLPARGMRPKTGTKPLDK